MYSHQKTHKPILEMPAMSCREFFWSAFKDIKHHKGLLFGREGPGMKSWPRVCVERVRRGSQQVRIRTLPPASQSDLRWASSLLLSLTFLLCKMGALPSVSGKVEAQGDDICVIPSTMQQGLTKHWFEIHLPTIPVE